jgi:NADH:ubiquinone oxidoreductase subunit 6 (subunit J)
MLILILVLVALAFSAQALRARRLLFSALWLAGASATLATVFYQLGAPEVAVIELSVGAGLVTVLFVFAINVAGEEGHLGPRVVPIWAGGTLVLVAAVLLGILVLPAPSVVPAASQASFAQTMWQARGLDVLVQMVLIFAGVLGLLGLLAESSAPLDQAVAKSVAAGRERDLKVLERTSEHVVPREEVHV